MTRLLRLHIRSLLVLLILLIPVFGLMVYTHVAAREQAVMAASDDALSLARLAAHDQGDSIESTTQFLMTLAQVPEIRKNDPEGCNQFLDRLLNANPLYQSLSVVQPNGDLVCSAPRAPSELNLLTSPSFRRAVESHDVTIGNFEIDPITATPGLGVSYPVLSSAGEIRAIVSADINLTQLSQLASQAQLPPGSALLVIDREGTILAHYPDPGTWVGQQPTDTEIIQAILAAPKERVAEATGVDGVRRLYAWLALPGSPSSDGGYVTVGIPSAVVYAPADRTLTGNLILLLAATSIFFLIAWELNDHLIVRRVNSFLEATDQLGAGNLATRINVPRRLGDWSEIANTFNRMAQSLQARERDLRSAETKYRTLVEQLPAVTYMWPFDADTVPAYISPQVEPILGFAPESYLAGRDVWLRQIHPEDRERVLNELQRGMVEGRPLQSEYRMITRSNRVIWVRDQAVIVPDEHGHALYLHGLLQDITDRKQAEQALRDAERKMRSVFDATFQFIGLLAPDGTLVDANKTALGFGGARLEQVLGRPLWELEWWEVASVTRQQVQEDIARALRSDDSVRREISFQNSKRPAAIDFSLRPIKDENGQVVWLVAEGHDISKIKRAEQALRASEERWRLQIEHMPIGCIVRDSDFRFQYWNPAAERIFGYKTSEVIGRRPSDLITPLEIQPHVNELLEQAAHANGTVHGTNANLTKDGRMIICEWWNTPLHDAKGQVIGILSMVQDVTEQQLAQHKIAYQAHLLASVSDAVIGMDAECRITFWNRAAERLSDRTEEQALGQRIKDVVRPMIPDHDLGAISEALREKGHMAGHVAFQRAEGHPLQIEWNAMALRNPAGDVTGFVVVSRDVTARLRAEEEIRQLNSALEQRVEERTAQLVEREAALMQANRALAQEEEKLRTLVDSIADEVWFCDAEGRVIQLNPAGWQGLGLEQVKPVSLTELLSDLQVFRPDGTRRPVEEAPLFHSLQGKTLDGEEILRHSQTGEMRFRHYSSAPVRDHTGRITGAVAVVTDMTRRKKIEDEVARLNTTLERRAAELENANRELDAFAYSVSHDLRTPLASINNLSRLIEQDYKGQLAPEGQRFFELIEENAIAMDRLIQDLLLFSRATRQPLKKQEVAPAELVEQALQDLNERYAGRQVEITVDDLPTCQADPVLLKQVFVNLLSNAIKFTQTREQTRIQVGCRVPELQDERVGLQMSTPSQLDALQTSGSDNFAVMVKPEIVYFVRDNGVGFDMSRAAKVFGVFQRLHGEDEYEGTGVGLAIVERIIHRHGGRVWAEAEIDQGATFYFTLP